MSKDWHETDSVRKKCEELDNELDVFFQSIKELKSIRDSMAEMPDRLKQNETDIVSKKREIEDMLSSTSNLLISFEEQAKGLFFDLEKKTDALTGNVKTSISDLRKLFESNSARLHQEHREKLDEIARTYEQVLSSHESLKKMISAHEQTIAVLQDNDSHIMKLTEKHEQFFREIRQSLTELHKRPLDADSKIKALETKLRESFFVNLDRQKKTILTMMAVLIAGIIFVIFYLSNLFSHY
ncbi:MAG: hypothetical protein C4538_05545 [Nitrospiraceae bacterium]|nr:MAG: hypothetical protein C4538_05545 [Nitrospiraceae bacterium]